MLAARKLFASTVIVTAAIIIWAQFFLPKNGAGLTQIFFLLFADSDSKAACWTLVILVVAAIASTVFSGFKLLNWIDAHMLVLMVATGLALCAGTLLVYRNHPLAMDEYAQVFQSQVFAAGRMSGYFPVAIMDWLVPPGFQNYFLSVSKTTGAVASGYWPSFALILAPFTALGISWACNPLISVLTLLAAHRLALKIYDDREAAAWVVLLTLASPEFLINGISYYSMPAHLLANTLYALLLLDANPRKALLAGVVGSIALTLHNPLPHLLFAVPWILWTAGRRDGNRLTLCLAAGYLPLCCVLGLGWFWFTGHLRQAGVAASPSGGDLVGMWKNLSIFSFPDRSVLLARSIGVAKIWVWAVPGLVILAGAGAWKGWKNPLLRLLAVSALLTLIGYVMVPVDQGHGWGYRYFHSAWIVLPILAAGALSPARTLPSSTFEDQASRSFMIACAVLMLVVGCTIRAVQVRNLITFDVTQISGYPGTEKRVILIDPRNTFYGLDLAQNDPWLRGDVIRMVSHGLIQDSGMMARNFPDFREVYTDPCASVWSKAPLDSPGR